MMHRPLNGGPPKNFDPVHRTTRSPSTYFRTDPSPKRPWQASTTGNTKLPYLANNASMQASVGIHGPVLLPTTMCTTMQPYVGWPSLFVAKAASFTASSTNRSRSPFSISWPLRFLMYKFLLTMLPPSMYLQKMDGLSFSGDPPEGNFLAKCLPIAASVVPEPTSPAAVTTVKVEFPRSGRECARKNPKSAGMSSASVPDGNKLRASSAESSNTARSRSRTAHNSLRKRLSGDEYAA
mmetsp:Transcript_98155/g.194379  ORF Transcript_98155/g.194379 Transcript_98155/m.194379 type:complete len:237 (+) Transcript_98155:769-1479(+)